VRDRGDLRTRREQSPWVVLWRSANVWGIDRYVTYFHETGVAPKTFADENKVDTLIARLGLGHI
jgi:hypothetical protein